MTPGARFLAHPITHWLAGLLPTCMHGKKIRDPENHWHPIETYISKRSEATFSHGICPECLKKHHADVDV